MFRAAFVLTANAARLAVKIKVEFDLAFSFISTQEVEDFANTASTVANGTDDVHDAIENFTETVPEMGAVVKGGQNIRNAIAAI